MRKTILLVAACVASMLATAQIFDVVSVQELTGASYEDARVAGISPAGDYILMTNGANQGLKRYDIASGVMTKVTDAEGAGFNVQISRDGKEVVFRERFTAADKLRYNNIVSANLGANTKKVIAKGQITLTRTP